MTCLPRHYPPGWMVLMSTMVSMCINTSFTHVTPLLLGICCPAKDDDAQITIREFVMLYFFGLWELMQLPLMLVLSFRHCYHRKSISLEWSLAMTSEICITKHTMVQGLWSGRWMLWLLWCRPRTPKAVYMHCKSATIMYWTCVLRKPLPWNLTFKIYPQSGSGSAKAWSKSWCPRLIATRWWTFVGCDEFSATVYWRWLHKNLQKNCETFYM